MDKKLYGRPATGIKVRDPDHDNRHVPDSAQEYPRTPYWLTRFRSGDMVPAEAEGPRVPAKKPAA